MIERLRFKRIVRGDEVVYGIGASLIQRQAAFYEWLGKKDIISVYKVFPWDFWTFNKPEDEAEFLQLYADEIEQRNNERND